MVILRLDAFTSKEGRATINKEMDSRTATARAIVQLGVHNMSEHPQLAAVRQAAGLLRDQRYWARNEDEELELLRTFMTLLREVSYHLDAMQALDPEGMAAYERATGTDTSFGRGSAELLLMTALDSTIERFLATGTSARNTGVRRIVPDGRTIPPES